MWHLNYLNMARELPGPREGEPPPRAPGSESPPLCLAAPNNHVLPPSRLQG